VARAKRNETRGKPTKVRGWVALHASKKPMDHRVIARHQVAEALMRHGVYGPQDMPTGAIVGLVHLTGCEPTDTLRQNVTSLEESFGNWGPGRFAWTIDRAVRLEYPVPATGRQGWWKLDAAQEADLKRSLNLGGQMTVELAIAISRHPAAVPALAPSDW
jgi:hypothetical protein